MEGHIAPNTTSNELGCLTDLMGTVAEVVDYQLPDNAGEDTYSMLPAMMGRKGKPIREAVVHHSNWECSASGRAIGNWNSGLGSGGFSDPRSEEPKNGGPQGNFIIWLPIPKEENNLWLDRPVEVARLTALLEKYKAEGHSRPCELQRAVIRRPTRLRRKLVRFSMGSASRRRICSRSARSLSFVSAAKRSFRVMRAFFKRLLQDGEHGQVAGAAGCLLTLDDIS